MPGEEDWVVETDGPPPSNSSIADQYEVVGPPVTCCDVPRSPYTGEMNATTVWLIVAVFIVMLIVLITGRGER